MQILFPKKRFKAIRCTEDPFEAGMSGGHVMPEKASFFSRKKKIR
jgi:hypothetical protein